MESFGQSQEEFLMPLGMVPGAPRISFGRSYGKFWTLLGWVWGFSKMGFGRSWRRSQRF